MRVGMPACEQIKRPSLMIYGYHLRINPKAEPMQQNNRSTGSILAIQCRDSPNQYAMFGDHRFSAKASQIGLHYPYGKRGFWYSLHSVAASANLLRQLLLAERRNSA
jgi:hypothetical protein